MRVLKALKHNLSKNTDLGLQLKALPSIIKFPDLYRLGKESIHMECKFCGLKPTHYIDVENIKHRGICFKCDELSQEYYFDAIHDFKATLDDMGIDPDDQDAVDMVMEGYSL